MLAVVKHQQQLRRAQPVPQRLDHSHLAALPHPQRLHHQRGHQLRVGDAGQIGQPHAVAETFRCPRGELHRQPGLPRAAGPGQRDQPRLAHQAFQRGQLPFPADETGQPQRQVVPLRARRRGNLLPQHRLLEPAQLLTRLDAQLLREHRAGAAVGGQRIGLPLAAVQRQHQQPPQPLPEWMLGDQALQLPGHLRSQPQREVGLDAALHRHQPKLLQPGALQRQRLHPRHVRERPAPPQPQRRPEPVGRTRRLPPLQHSRPAPTSCSNPLASSWPGSAARA